LKITSSPVRDGDGQLIAAVATFEDRTEQQAREQDRARRQRRLAALQATSEQLVGMTELEAVLRHVVSSARSLVAAEIAVVALVDPLTGRITTTFHEGFTADQIPPNVEIKGKGLLGMLLAGQELFTNNVRAHPGFTGFPAWHPQLVSCLGVPVRDEQTVTAVLLVGSTLAGDYTEEDLEALRSLANLAGVALRTSRLFDELRRSENLLRTTLENAATSVMFLAPDCTITDVNDAFVETTGFSREEVIGKHCAVLLGEPCSTGCQLFAGAKHERIVGRECTITARDGRQLVVRKNAQLLRDADGQVTGAIECFEDITDLVTAREEALSASRAKSAFLARMSHEIRTPMNGVMGMLSLALDTPLTAEQEDFLTTAYNSAQALLTLINDILDFSKIEAGRLEVRRVVFDVGATVEGAVATVAATASHKGLELACRIAEDIPPLAVGDPDRLRQVLVNLLGNAVKFTDAGEVVVTVERERTDAHQHWLCFTVKDTGCGISAADLPRVFEAFEQGDGTVTRTAGGTGLGLAISRQLVHLMGGAIWAESWPGRGSTFRVRLPLGIVATAPAPTPPVPTLDLAGLRVLVVDDNATNRRIVSAYLRSWGCEPYEAADARQALQVLRTAAHSAPFPLALVDALMPDIGGFELTRMITQAPELRATRVVMVSSLEAGNASEALACGAVGYVLKPIRRASLHEAVVKALGERPAASAPPPVAPAKAATRPLRVLLAEDNPVNQQVAVKTMTRAGHQVRVAANGYEALAALVESEFDVVLMDVQMPELDGLEAARRLREEPRLANLPVIALTAHALDGDRERCLAAGMNDYLAKPYTPDELLAALAKWAPAATADAAYPAASATAEAGSPATPAVVLEHLLATCEGDRDFARQLIEELITHTSAQLAAFTEATRAQDWAAAQRIAHTVKGGAAAVAAIPLRDAAEAAERAAREGHLDPEPARQALATALAQVKAWLAASGLPTPQPV